MRNWKEKHISETGNRSMAFRDQKNWVKRTPEEQARLQFLREKQQPEVDWSVDWDNFELRDDISPNCVFQAKKVTTMFGEQLEQAQVAAQERVDAITHIWETYRLKAVLRSGKMLPYALMKRINSRSKWTVIQKWIEEAGELPGLSLTVLAAVQEVNNQGYQDALDEIQRGEIAKNGTADERRQNRALDLVSNILRAWEAQDRR